MGVGYTLPIGSHATHGRRCRRSSRIAGRAHPQGTKASATEAGILPTVQGMGDGSAWLDAISQLELIRRGEVSGKELVEAAIARIEQLNPQLNAVIHPHFDAALDRPGVPFLVKDVLATEAGQPCHCGLRAARDAHHTAGANSWLVRRYRDSGLSSLGRTNTAELAASLTTEPVAYGATRNPWDLSRSPGGSSGGSAAAVASGMVAAAHGNNMAAVPRTRAVPQQIGPLGPLRRVRIPVVR